MKQFIYVMKEHDAAALLKHNYELVQKDERNSLWIFENKGVGDELDHLVNGRYILSDMISL